MPPPYENIELIRRYAQKVLRTGDALAVTRASEGVSTFVYKVQTDDETYYLRILPEPDASFAPEAAVHNRLHAFGLPVPRVLHFEHLNPLF